MHLADHTADTATWLCAACTDIWPCRPARVHWSTHPAGPTHARGWLALRSLEFAEQHPKADLTEVHRRFLEWLVPGR